MTPIPSFDHSLNLDSLLEQFGLLPQLYVIIFNFSEVISAGPSFSSLTKWHLWTSVWSLNVQDVERTFTRPASSGSSVLNLESSFVQNVSPPGWRLASTGLITVTSSWTTETFLLLTTTGLPRNLFSFWMAWNSLDMVIGMMFQGSLNVLFDFDSLFIKIMLM